MLEDPGVTMRVILFSLTHIDCYEVKGPQTLEDLSKILDTIYIRSKRVDRNTELSPIMF